MADINFYFAGFLNICTDLFFFWSLTQLGANLLLVYHFLQSSLAYQWYNHFHILPAKLFQTLQYLIHFSEPTEIDIERFSDEICSEICGRDDWKKTSSKNQLLEKYLDNKFQNIVFKNIVLGTPFLVFFWIVREPTVLKISQISNWPLTKIFYHEKT